MKTKIYTKEQKQLVKDWATKWQQFFKLLDILTEQSQHPPTAEDEMAFQKLRLWFLMNERIFIPIWNAFCDHSLQNCTDKISVGELEALDEDKFVAFLKNPFSFYYRPGTLYQCVHHIGLQYSIDIWAPSEEKMQKVRPILSFLSKVLLEEMVNWVDG